MNPSNATERASPVQVFYDSLCPVCRREIAFLKRKDKAGNLQTVDFTAPDFDPAAYGLELSDLVSRMYVRDANGVLHEGLDSFPDYVGPPSAWAGSGGGLGCRSCANWGWPATPFSAAFVPASPASAPAPPTAPVASPAALLRTWFYFLRELGSWEHSHSE